MKFCTRIEKIWSLIRPLLGGSWTCPLLHLFAFALNSCGRNLILATLLWSILKNQAVPNVSIWEREIEKYKTSWLSQNLLPNIYAYIGERIMNIFLYLLLFFFIADRYDNYMIWTTKSVNLAWACLTKNEDIHIRESQRKLHRTHKGQYLGSGD